MDDPIRIDSDEPGNPDMVDSAMRRHLVRTDPATGLANRLVLVELLRGLAMPPVPHELVGGVTLAIDEVLCDSNPARRRDRATTLGEFGRFVTESAPEGAIAASIADGLVLMVLPNAADAKVRAVAARCRALWMRRRWSPRGLPRPRMRIQAKNVPTAATEGGWFDSLLAQAREQAVRRA